MARLVCRAGSTTHTRADHAAPNGKHKGVILSFKLAASSYPMMMMRELLLPGSLKAWPQTAQQGAAHD